MLRLFVVALAFMSAGLFTARLLAALLAMELSSYTAIALLFEMLTCTFATGLLALDRQGAAPDPRSP